MSTEDKDLQEKIDAAVAEAVEGLKTKNAELLGKLKKAQAGAAIDPADLEAVERERDQLKADLAAANKVAKKATADAEAANKKAADAEAASSKLLVDNGLTDSLVKAGVTNPVHQKAAKAMLASQATIVADGDVRVVKLGDKPIGEAVKEWAGSDEGKHFVTAADTSGSGTQNSGHKPNTNQPKGDAGGDKAAMTARAAELINQFED